MIAELDVKRLAQLSGLRVDDAAGDELRDGLERMIAFADAISAAGDRYFEEAVTEDQLRCDLREDCECVCLPREAVLQNAAQHRDGMFVIRTLEEETE